MGIAGGGLGCEVSGSGQYCGGPTLLPCGAFGMGKGCQASPRQLLTPLACFSPPMGCLPGVHNPEVGFIGLPLPTAQHGLPHEH